jgi:acyl-coenzyme A thioesterase PaaI-like protein
MSESFQTRLDRWKFNIFPAYRGTGARVDYISADWKQVRVRIPLSIRTRNYVGTIYGGSLYGGVDPIYMLMLIRLLGREFVVWDKAATIRFRRPGRETLWAEFTVDDAEIAEIKRLLESNESINRIYKVELKNRQGEVHCEVEKTLYIARKKSQ